FLVKPRCVPLDGDSHRSRNDQCQVSKPQHRLNFAVVLVRHGLDFHHTASSSTLTISTSTRSGSPVTAYTCSATTWRSSRYATPFNPSIIDFAALSMSARRRPFEYSHSLSATGPSIIVTPAARASHATRSSYSRVSRGVYVTTRLPRRRATRGRRLPWG